MSSSSVASDFGRSPRRTSCYGPLLVSCEGLLSAASHHCRNRYDAMIAASVEDHEGLALPDMSGCETSLALSAIRRALMISHGPARPDGLSLARAGLPPAARHPAQ